MTPDEADAFWALHRGLPREGPGHSSDVAWAAQVANIPVDARICDAGCGPGADFEALLAAAPQGHVTGVESHPDFVEAAAARNLDSVVVRQGDIAELTGPYDFIWAAGSLYFIGIVEGLRLWRGALAPGGAVAFTEPCWLVPNPAHELRRFWRRYPQLTSQFGIASRVEEAGWHSIRTRVLSDAAWEAYLEPLEARLGELRETGSHPVWDDAEQEIDLWRRHRRSLGYLLSVVRPA